MLYALVFLFLAALVQANTPGRLVFHKKYNGKDMCVGVGSSESGHLLHLLYCTDPRTHITRTQPGGATREYVYRFTNSNNIAMDVPEGAAYNGALLQGWTFHNGWQQRFGNPNNHENTHKNPVNRPTEHWGVVWFGGSYGPKEKCLDVSNGNVWEWQTIQMWDCMYYNTNQRFRWCTDGMCNLQ